jgi:hypothetical protein
MHHIYVRDALRALLLRRKDLKAKAFRSVVHSLALISLN